MPNLTYKRRNTYEENSLILVLTLALVLSACSNNSGNKSNNENDSKDTVSIKIAFQQVEMTKVVMRIKN